MIKCSTEIDNRYYEYNFKKYQIDPIYSQKTGRASRKIWPQRNCTK